MTRSRDVAATQSNVGGAVGPFLAGKNKIINGDFGVNQRQFTSVNTNLTYTFDRFFSRINGDGTATFTPQIFTTGTAPVAGYEGKNYLQIATASQTSTTVFTVLRQAIENVRTFAGQTVTVSFWAKSASGTPKVSISFTQTFGTSGSAQVTTSPVGVTLSTSWTRYSAVIAIPSISGKTIGTANDYIQLNLCVSAGSTFTDDNPITGIQNNTFSFWGVQVEAGSVATPFQTATGTLAGELAACQRYYFRWNAIDAYSPFAQGISTTTTNAQIFVQYPVTMRTKPTTLEFSTLVISDIGSYNLAISAITLSNGSASVAEIGCTNAATATANRAAFIRSNNSASGYLAFGAEL